LCAVSAAFVICSVFKPILVIAEVVSGCAVLVSFVNDILEMTPRSPELDVLTDVAVLADATLVFLLVAIMLFVVVGIKVVSFLPAALSVVISGSLELRGVT